MYDQSAQLVCSWMLKCILQAGRQAVDPPIEKKAVFWRVEPYRELSSNQVTAQMGSQHSLYSTIAATKHILGGYFRT